MQNPILTRPVQSLYYALAWLVMAGLQVAATLYWLPAVWYTWLSDALLMHLLFALAGLGIWYVVRYNPPEIANFWNLLVSHLVAALVLSAALVLGGQWLLALLFSKQESYLAHLEVVLPWRLVFGLFYYSLLAVIYYLLLYQSRFKEKTIREGELRAMVKEAELSMLKLQINPHFIFNSLNSIASLTMIDADKARNMIIKLSEFLRYSLQKEEQGWTSLRQELDNMQLYLDIERIRFEDLLEVETDISEAALNMRLPLLITQPLVENAIKHGVYEATEQVKLKVSAFAERRSLCLQIGNDVTGIAGTQKGQGIGLSNIRERMRLLYDRDDLLEIRKEPAYFEVTLRFPQID